MLVSAVAPSQRKGQVLKSFKRLQPFPPVVAELMRVVAEDEAKFKEISALIRADAAVSAEILRMANSPLLGARSQINSVLHAVVVLGLERVRGLVMTLTLRRFLSSALEVPSLLRCWRHNMACALLCEELATACFLAKDPCYTAGLLHDIGRLALLASFPSDYANALDMAERYQLGVLECERGMFGMDHCEAGQWLVEEWGFPEEFRAITGRHHQSAPEGRFDKISLVQFCCRMSDTLGFMASVFDLDGAIPPLWSRLPVAPWYRFPSQSELSLTIGDKINALECSLLN